MLLSNDRNFFFAAGNVTELHNAVNQGKQSIVGAAANVLTGMDVGASLSDQNVAGRASLAVSLLNAQTLRLRISAVLGRAHAFFMCEKLQS